MWRRSVCHLAAAVCCVQAAVGVSLAKFEPLTGCYVGAFIEHDAATGGSFGAFDALTGKRHASYMTYSGYGRPFPAEWVARVAQHGAAAHLGWEPNDGLQAVQDDGYLRAWARAARASGIPIFLRFASEMNGNWMPYSGNPTLFIEKWRLVAHVMEEEAPNVAMVWCVFPSPEKSIPDYYPGDDTVDWVGVNVYSLMYHNADPAQPAGQKDPRDALRYVYRSYSNRKPIMICEYAATSYCKVVGGPTVTFALDKMTTLYGSLTTEFPRVKGILWFSLDGIARGLADNNYSVTWDPRLVERYKMLVSGDYFLSRVEGLQQALHPPRTTTGGPRPVADPAPADEPKEGADRVASKPQPAGEEVSADRRVELGLANLAQGTVVTGRTVIEAFFPADWDVRYVSFRCNGKTFAATNRSPFRATFDPAGLEPGRYELTVRVMSEGREPAVSEPVGIEVRRP